MTAADTLLWPEEAAALIKVSPATFKRMLSQSKRAHAEGRPRPAHLPLPVGYQPRQVSNGHHLVTVTSGRWRLRTLQEWQAARPGSPGRPRKVPVDA